MLGKRILLEEIKIYKVFLSGFLLSGYLQSLFGVYSVRIENVGVRRPPSDDVQIQGIANPNAFKKVLFVVVVKH